MRSLAIDYKEGKDKEILNLNSELDKFRKMVEESQSIYEKMLEKTTQSLEDIIKKTEDRKKVQSMSSKEPLRRKYYLITFPLIKIKAL